MSRAHLSIVAPVLFLAVGCQPKAPEFRERPYPKLSLNQDTLEFGSLEFTETATRNVIITNDGYTVLQDVYLGMLMGVGSRSDEPYLAEGIDIGPGMDGNFKVEYNKKDITCPEGSEEDTGDGASADAKAKDTATTEETGVGGSETGKEEEESGGGGGGGEGDGKDDFSRFTLGPACSIPVTVTFAPVDVGDVWGSLIVQSVQADQTVQQAEDNELPDYLRDPVRFMQQVYLHGEGEQGEGTIVVTPRSHDYGYVFPEGHAETARVAVRNVGTGEILLSDAVLSGTCGTEFVIRNSFTPGAALAAGESTLVEIDFLPTDTDPAICELVVGSNDVNNVELKVTLKGNTGADPNNTPPTAAIRWPEPGYEYNSPNPLDIELNVFDKNQPAESLTCKIKSSLTTSTIADCTPSDESGHVVVSLARDLFDSGTDTLTVVVTDANGVSGSASVSVLVNSAYPDGDDDGDAYGDEMGEDGIIPDCDDGNRDTYPDATEVFDGEDNDCDGITDEGTEGFDDDGDSVSEADGDCNDYNAQAYPGAPERADSVDNDCDGVVDESTALYDDDGDGFAEINNDCDDTNPDVNPSEVEVCDGLDNDCDGLYDSADSCLATNSEPMVVGYPRPSQNACLENEQISITVKVFDADGQIPTFSWGNDDAKGAALFDNPFAQTVNFTCPALAEGSGGKNVTVYVLAQDTDAHQVWADTKIAVYPDDYALHDAWSELVPGSDTGEAAATGLCAGSPLVFVGGLTLVGALATRRRRRE